MTIVSLERAPRAATGRVWPYRVVVSALVLALVLLLTGDAWMLYRRQAYRVEIARLRANMTAAERHRSDLIVAGEKDKLAIELVLARLQMNLDPHLHLAISVDSGRMYLEREGAILREMPVQIGRSVLVSTGSAPYAPPLGDRTIIAVRSHSPITIEVSGGAMIHAPSASDSNSTAVTPNEVRGSAADLQAILADVYPGMKVYFY